MISRLLTRSPGLHSIARPERVVRICRTFAVMQPRRGTWTCLPPTQRAAWEALGWTAESWEDHQSPPPESFLKRWSQLSSAQQAAALHGLVVSQNEWDAMVGSSLEISRKDSSRLPRDYDKSEHMKTVPVSGLRKNETKDERQSHRKWLTLYPREWLHQSLSMAWRLRYTSMTLRP